MSSKWKRGEEENEVGGKCPRANDLRDRESLKFELLGCDWLEWMCCSFRLNGVGSEGRRERRKA